MKISFALMFVAVSCAFPAAANNPDIVWPSPGAVVTATPVKVSIEAPDRQSDSFGVTINGKSIEQLFSNPENGKSSALLRRRNLRIGENTLRIRYANHETSSVDFTYAPAATGLGGSAPASTNPDYFAIQTRLVGGAGVNPGDYYTQVGSTRYVAPDSNGVTGFHVVALDRADGSLKFNIVLPNYGLQGAFIAAQIQQQAAKSCTGEWGCILIISSMQTIGSTPCPIYPRGSCDNFDPGVSMAYLGGTTRINYLDGTRGTNSYSMITTIGQYGQGLRSSGQADERLACQSSSGCLVDGDAPNVWTGHGDISGALVADNHNALTFTPVSRPTFSLQATPNAGDINTITVNGQRYSASLAGASGGFHILILDASNLGVSFNYALPATAGGLSTIVQGVGAYLSGSGATQNILVFVASMGDLGHSNAQGQWLQVAQLFSQFGATYHLVSGLKSGDDYAMIGAPPTESFWAALTPAAESSSVITRHATTRNPLPPTQLLGFLKKNHFGYYRPGASNLQYDTENTTFADAASSIQGALLDKAALQPPVSWPICNNCAVNDGSNPQLNAYQAISYYLTVVGKGSGNPDIRSDYPADATDTAMWSQYQSNTTSLTMPSLQTWLGQHEADKPYLMNFSAANFAAVQNQLETELAYMLLITTYEQHLAHAVDKNKTNLESEIGTIYDELATELQVNKQSQSSVKADIINAIIGGLSIASYGFGFEAAPAVNLALDAFSVTLSYSMSLNNTQSGVPVVADQLRSTVANLKVDTNTQFNRSLDSLSNMFSLIYTDWGRMQTLGNALANNPQPAIVWTEDTANAYVKAMATSMAGQYVGAFFSTLYNVYSWGDLTSGGPPQKNYLAVCNNEGVSSGDCNLGQHFDGSDWLNVRDRPNGQTPSSNNDGNYWNVYLMAAKDASFHGHTYGCFEGTCLCRQEVGGAYPLDSVMQEIFAPIGTYPDLADNLGLYPPWFFTRYGIPFTGPLVHTGCTSGD